MVNHQLRVEDLGRKETNKQKNIRRSKHNSSPVECREWRCWWGKPNAITHSPTMTGCHFISAQIRVYLCIPMYTYVYLRMYNIWSWGWFFLIGEFSHLWPSLPSPSPARGDDLPVIFMNIPSIFRQEDGRVQPKSCFAWGEWPKR